MVDNNSSSIPVTLALPIQNPSSSSSSKLPKRPTVLNSPNFFKAPHQNNTNTNTNNNNNNKMKKRKRKKKKKRPTSSSMMRELMRFGEVYERVEISKAKREVEMEKLRIEFAKEIQLNRMDLVVKIQMEIAKLKNQ